MFIQACKYTEQKKNKQKKKHTAAWYGPHEELLFLHPLVEISHKSPPKYNGTHVLVALEEDFLYTE